MDKTSQTIGQLFLGRVSRSSSDRAIGWFEKDKLTFMTYKEYGEVVQALTMGLLELGLGQDEKVSILSGTRKEWHFCDLAILAAQGATIPIYHTYVPKEIGYIFNHSNSHIFIIENNALLSKVLQVQDQLINLTHIIMLEKPSPENREKIKSGVQVHTYDEVHRLGQTATEKKPNLFEEKIKSQSSDDIASIIYTSGTTGEPKGAVITHKAFTTMLKNAETAFANRFTREDRTLTWLPLSHVFGRCESMLPLIFGWEMVFAEGISRLLSNLESVKPTIVMAVPRIFEEVYNKITAQIKISSVIKRKLFNWAKETLTTYHDKIASGAPVNLNEMFWTKLAYKLVFSKVYDRFGGKVRYLISGGAPLSKEIIKFLRNADLIILEGYGLTETVAPCTINPADKPIPATVGIPMGDVQIKIADDGEILIKTEAMFKEYYNNPEATAQTIKDGWLYSGDIGEFTSEGYLKITDRKKDIIVTAGGKNVAPQKIENMLKLQDCISHSIVIGDNKNFLSALIAIEQKYFPLETLKKLGLTSDASLEDISKSERVHEIIQNGVSGVNKDLAGFEKIKKFYILPQELTVDNDLLTPSLKLKKKKVLNLYQREVEQFYQ